MSRSHSNLRFNLTHVTRDPFFPLGRFAVAWYRIPRLVKYLTTVQRHPVESTDEEGRSGNLAIPGRLGLRFQKLVRQLATRIGQSIPLACQDWTNTKAAYRFLSDGRVNEAAILAGHFQATRNRVAAVSGTILILHDTTEFTYSRESMEALGFCTSRSLGAAKMGALGSIRFAAF